VSIGDRSYASASLTALTSLVVTLPFLLVPQTHTPCPEIHLPASSVMNSRRFIAAIIRSPRRRGRGTLRCTDLFEVGMHRIEKALRPVERQEGGVGDLEELLVAPCTRGRVHPVDVNATAVPFALRGGGKAPTYANSAVVRLARGCASA
jgi:hypothetical protein